MKVLVTGATGVYGRSVVERLHRAGHDIVAMARNPPRSLPPGVRFASADVCDLASVKSAMQGCQVVAHLAFVVTPVKDREESRRISVGGTKNILEAMRRTGARRLVFASSAMGYGANPDNPPLFTEQHKQRPAHDYVYGTDKVAAERLIIDSGIEAVIARTAVTVSRNIDNLLVDIFAGPAIVGIKGVDIRYQLVHQDDVGRFFALACEQGPPGAVNVSPPDFLPLRRIAEILGKRYVEVSASQALKAIKFMWEHDLADITPGEAAGISYLPRMATDRLREEWGFECAWSTADAVLDLRRAVTGILSVAKRRIELPWRLRFPTQRPGIAVLDDATAQPCAVKTPSELDTPVSLRHPTYTRAVAADGPLPALTLTTHAYALRAAAIGVLNALGRSGEEYRELGDLGAGVFGHRLYVNDDVRAAVAGADPTRRRIIDKAYRREVKRLAAWAADTLARAIDLPSASDDQLDATLSSLRDELAWFWAIVAVGAALSGDRLSELDGLVTVLPGGSSLAAVTASTAQLSASSDRHAAAVAHAERTAIALGQALALAVSERAARLVAAGALAVVEDVAHLTWDELVSRPTELDELVLRRRAEFGRLREEALPATISATGPESAIQPVDMPSERAEAVVA
jgi:nucleoside-diphosphate-sugar epimerase